MELLAQVKTLIENKGYSIGNMDMTLMAQRPRIKSFIGDMTSNIARVLAVEESQINIKGTTTEKLGFIGREEGIAAQAVCLLCR